MNRLNIIEDCLIEIFDKYHIPERSSSSFIDSNFTWSNLKTHIRIDLWMANKKTSKIFDNIVVDIIYLKKNIELRTLYKLDIYKDNNFGNKFISLGVNLNTHILRFPDTQILGKDF